MTKSRNRKAALRFFRNSMKRYGQPEVIVTDKLRCYRAAMNTIRNAERQQSGRWLNNPAENSHLPFRRRERAIHRFDQMRSLQEFATVHSSVLIHFNQERHLYSNHNFKINRRAALNERRQLCLVKSRHQRRQRLVRINLAAPFVLYGSESLFRVQSGL